MMRVGVMKFPHQITVQIIWFVVQQLLSKPKFSGVEKIKTIGSTYMAAAGLSGTPGQENNQVE